MRNGGEESIKARGEVEVRINRALTKREINGFGGVEGNKVWIRGRDRGGKRETDGRKTMAKAMR